MPRLSPATPVLLAALLLWGTTGCVQLTETLPAPALPARWPQETSDLKPDPAVTWGRLDNGLRYAILPHATPAGRVSAFLLVQTGSYYERASESGYAHFIEHLAYRDLRGVPDGVIATLEKLGADTTSQSMGTTGLFETEYRLDNLPVDEPATLATGLHLLRAIADGIEFNAASISREGGVILAEGLTRGAMMANGRPSELEFLPPAATPPRPTELAALFGNTRLTHRFPIGEEGSIRGATAPRLRAFYERWYRPERMVLAIVGEVQPGAVVDLVRQQFASLVAQGSPPTPPALEWPDRRGTLGAYLNHWETEPLTRVAFCSLAPVTGSDTAARRRESLVRRLALAMLNGRLERDARSDDATVLSAEPILSHSLPGLELGLIRADVTPPLWLKAVTMLDYEMRRAREQGFAGTELARVVKAETIRVNAAARQADHRPAPELAQALAFATARGVVFTSAADDRDLTAAQLATITEAQCQSALARLLPPEKLSLAIAGPFPGGPPDFSVVAKAMDASRGEAVVAYPPPPPLRPFPYTDFGPAGEVVRTVHVADYDADLLQFANGVRLNLKRTSFEPGRVHAQLRVDIGRLATPADKPGLELKTLGWPFGGLRGLSSEELAATLTDLENNPSVAANADDFRLSDNEDAANLPLLLQLLAALFTQPAFREEKRAVEYARQSVASYSITASGTASLAFQQRMTSGHPALRLANAEQLARLTNDDLKAWLLPQLASAPLELSLVGDFDPPAAIEAVARTLGALPARGTADPFAALRQVAFPPPPFTDTVTFSGNSGVAAAMLGWPAPEAQAPAASARGRLLAAILEQRLWQKLRVEMGETYALGASFDTDDTYRPTLRCLHCSVETAPAQIEKIAAVVRSVATTLGREGATAEELERARGPMVHDVETGLRNNDWLLDLVSVAQSDPDYALGWAHAADDYRTATLAEINALAREVLVDARFCQLIARPK